MLSPSLDIANEKQNGRFAMSGIMGVC